MGATLDDDGWMLERSDDRAARDSALAIPPEEERRALKPGSRVRLSFIFVLGDGSVEGEMLSVTIFERTGDGAYLGALAEDPISSSTVTAGAAIAFDASHVAAID
jgi:hypothetical protein